MNIYVGNIDFKVEDHELKSLFEQFGAVDSAKIIKDKFTGRSRGFGFIEMPNEAEAKIAIEQLDGELLGTRNILVKKAMPQRER